jgi:hypothetical protein
MKKNMRLSRIIGRTAGFFPGSLSFFLPRRSARAKRLCRRRTKPAASSHERRNDIGRKPALKPAGHNRSVPQRLRLAQFDDCMENAS